MRRGNDEGRRFSVVAELVKSRADPHGKKRPTLLQARLRGMAAATGPATAGILRRSFAFRQRLADDADGEFHVLQRDVFADGGDELLDQRVGRDGAVELEADGLAGEVREGVGHLAVEREAEVGVHLFLKLEDALLGAVPRAGLDHDEDGFASLAVNCEGIEAARVFDAECAGCG